jgi:hypothetical protein
MRPPDPMRRRSYICGSPERKRRGKKCHRFDAVAVTVANIGRVVALAMLRAKPGRPVRRASVSQRRGMKSIDHLAARCAQRNVRACAFRLGREPRSIIEPELGIALAESDRRRTRLELRIADRKQDRFVETRGALKIGNGNGDVIDHAFAPDLTSL